MKTVQEKEHWIHADITGTQLPDGKWDVVAYHDTGSGAYAVDSQKYMTISTEGIVEKYYGELGRGIVGP